MIPNALPLSLQDNPRLDQWIGFPEAGRVAVRTGKVELGQGLLTALVQIAAEELDVAVARIQLATGDTAATPDEGYTAGSRSVELSGGAIRLVCAEVRAMALDAAARRLGCDAASLALEDGVILKDGLPTGLDYWAVADDLDLTRTASGAAPAKAAARFKVVGTDVPRLDLPAKIGGAPFIQDLAPDGLLHARVLHRPRLGARLVALDEAAALKAGGGAVDLHRSGDLVALIGPDEAKVLAAFQRLRDRARWEGGVDLGPGDAEALSLLDRPAAPPRIVERGAPLPAARRLRATYSKPYIAHGSIAPSCGLALFEAGRLTVWTHSQGVFFLRSSIARALGLEVSAVHVIHHQGAGCYGHNGADDAAFDAAFAALACPGRPVRVLWTREDELGVAPFGAPMVVTLDAGFDADARPVDWTIDIVSPTHVSRPGAHGGVNLLGAAALADAPPAPAPADLPDPAGGGASRNAFLLYDLPHQKLVHRFIPAPPVRTSSMRGLGAFANVFALESFIDEAAEAAGLDPVAYRLKLMADPRARAVISAAAEMADWDSPPPDGFARGFAFSRYKNVAAYLAMAVELSVEEEVRVSRVWCAVDGGLVINPDGARNQIEGGVIQAISWTLKEQVTFADGAVASNSWETYPILRFSEVPEIETRLIGDPTHPPLGLGEVSQGPTAAAIGNAVARALGARLRHLPLTRERIMAALLEG
ncbi:xanthine dehydrogenase family protein molybdopterin-binding subunit [Aquabacter spiritensis]|uniref:CO/xanthine dehydrogenase Mo-binding subunit n=1 Tax=Aquabacter spiritensis TaxID=933073 RepID=A0A4R3M1C9_9HYPH|nr:molybdopterin cofactor-binding domain-containing protein [Aquabacter spiritensis]TCT05979.1 CO/xanthine dehydrogenase Mo-binding subunit [Aquabacter spiritensis]